MWLCRWPLSNQAWPGNDNRPTSTPRSHWSAKGASHDGTNCQYTWSISLSNLPICVSKTVRSFILVVLVKMFVCWILLKPAFPPVRKSTLLEAKSTSSYPVYMFSVFRTRIALTQLGSSVLWGYTKSPVGKESELSCASLSASESLLEKKDKSEGTFHSLFSSKLKTH